MPTAVVTGSASGMGAAVRRVLEGDGYTVVGVDLRDAEVTGDLSTAEGRTTVLAAVRERCTDGIDRLAVCAGVGGEVDPPSLVVRVNYFGALAVVDGVLDLMTGRPDAAAVVIGSNSAQLLPVDDHPLVVAMLDEDEPAAVTVADEGDGQTAYMTSKHALGRALRRRAMPWGQAGVRLNVVAPGPVDTPLLRRQLDDEATGAAIAALPNPLGRHGTADEVADLIGLLLSPRTSWVHGAVWYVDGGIDAAMRPERY